ncbi:hypothetical protein AB0B25_04450 [Nocardia sp. NPDC049190]|uniref:hypothetical protein n=1 Tax=Nocardia sp. NPDC049190 TaxID=3155650 RepID=UPI0033CABCFC
MTDTTPTAEATEQTDPTTEQHQAPDTEAAETDAEHQTGNREAAKYRRQLRDTEAERDSLRERVTTYERAEVERLVADHLADPADLWVSGVELDALRGKDGAIDQDKVKTAVAELLEQRPHWQKRLKPLAPPASLVSGATGTSDRLGTSWSDAFSRSRGD